MICHYGIFNTHNTWETIDSFARGPYIHLFKWYAFILSTKMQTKTKTVPLTLSFQIKKNQINRRTMVSEFVLGQPQTTPQDHFL